MVENETSSVPRLVIQQNRYIRGWLSANLELQLKEWVLKAHSDWADKRNFAGAIVGDKTGKILEYRDLIKKPELRETWIRSLANELGILTQVIREVRGTDTIVFINKEGITKDKFLRKGCSGLQT